MTQKKHGGHWPPCFFLKDVQRGGRSDIFHEPQGYDLVSVSG
jgi:hypothetical protein